MKSPANKVILLASIASLLIAPSLHAITKAGAGSGTDLFQGTAWTGGTAPGANDIALWDTTSQAGAQSASSPVIWSKMTFTNLTGPLNISGSQITLSGAASNGSFNVLDVTAGTQAISFANDLVLTGVNSTSTVVVGNNTTRLQLNAGGANLTVGNVTSNGGGGTNDANLWLRGSGAGNIVNGTITVDGQLAKGDTGTWTLNGANSVGWVFFNNGALLAGNNAAFGSGTIYIGSGGGNVTIASSSSAARSYTNALDFTANNGGAAGNGFTSTANFGQTTGGTGTQSFSGTVNLGTINRNIATNSDTTFAGVVSGAGGAITKSGVGTLTLSGANTYTGGTTVNAGYLVFTSPSAVPTTGLITVNGNGALVASGAQSTVSGWLSSGKIAPSSTGTIAITADASDNIDFAAGGFNNLGLSSTGTATYSGTITAGTGGYKFGGDVGIFTVSSNLTQATTLTKNGAGTVALTGANTYTGSTTVNAGTLKFVKASSLYGSTTDAVASNASVTASNLVVNSGATAAFNVGGSGEFTASDIQYIAALSDVSAATATQGFKNGANIGLDTTNASGGSFTYGNVIADHVGSVTDKLGLAKLGAGTLVLTGANTYSGDTSVSAGTLNLANSLALQNSTLATGGVVFDSTVASHAFTVGGLKGSGNIALQDNASTPNAVALTVGSNNLSTAYSGILSGAGSLIKTGTGTLTLSSSNTHTGGTEVTAGTLVLGNASALGSGALTITATGGNIVNTVPLTGAVTLSNAIVLNNTGDTGFLMAPGIGNSVNLSGNITGTTSRLFLNTNAAGDGAAFYTLSGNNTFTTTTSIYVNRGSLRIGSATALGDATNTLHYDSNPGTLSFAGSYSIPNNINFTYAPQNIDTGANTVTLSGIIGGNQNLTKIGTGTLVLSAANTYTGTTTIKNGTVQLAGAAGDATNLLQPSTSLLIGDTATQGKLVLGSATGFSDQEFAGLTSTGQGGSIVNGSSTAASTLTVNNVAGNTSTFAGTLGGAGQFENNLVLRKQGAGTLVLSGNNTYTGGTTISEGTLNLLGSLAAGSAVTVGTGATFGGTGTANGAVTVSNGGILAPGVSGSGTLTVGSLIFGAVSGDTATVNIGVANGITSSALQVNGNVVANGGAGNVIFALGSSLATLSTGNYHLLSYTGTQLSNSSAFAWSGTIGPRQAVNLVNATKAIDLSITSAWVIWKGGTSSDWSGFTGNWTLSGSGAGTSFLANDIVRFDSTAANGTVDLTADVNPSSVSFEGNTRDYTLGSANGSKITTGLLIKSGNSSLTITTANVYDGGTTITGGRVRIGNNLALGTGMVTFAGGSLAVVPSAAFTLDNAITLNTATNIGDATDNGDLTFNGSVGGTGSLTKAGSGTLTLANDNTYAGGTTISAGTLQLGNGGTTGSLAASSAITNNGTLVFNRSNPAVFANSISGSGAVTQAGSGTLTLSGNNSYTGGTALSAGALVLGNASALGTGPLTITATGNAVVSTVPLTGAVTISNDIALNNTGTTGFLMAPGVGNSVNLSGNITGTTAQFFLNTNAQGDGAATFTLSGNNTFTTTDEIYVNRGSLRIGSATALGASTNTLHYDSNAGTLSFAGSYSIANNINFTFAPQNIDTGANTVTLSGAIGGNQNLTKIGSGTLLLSGANTYTGSTTVSAGTLLVSGSIAGSAVTVNSTGTLGGAGGTTGTVIVNNGGTLSPGASIGQLNTIGDLTLNPGATFNLEIDTIALIKDLLGVTGNLNLAQTNDSVLKITDLNPAAITSGTLAFITYSGTWNGGLFTVGGTVIHDQLETFTVGGNSYMLDYDNGGNSVALIAVPEPSAAMAIVGGAAMLLGLRRRQRRG